MTEDDMTTMQRQMKESREKNFAVEVSDSKYHNGEICLSVTTNGYQWQTMSFTPDELTKVIAALSGYNP
jgi:hypothetical protein